MDKIFIQDLRTAAVVGTLPHERTSVQEIVLNLELACDLAKAGRSDALEDTVNYKAVKQAVLKLVEASSFKLLEALAQNVADACLAFEGVEAVKVRIDKPNALRFAKSVAVEIQRERK
jgi:dihydroneopterin aldolase/D-erythro-7,8-dihydroneopterin triphosphate epimerase